MVRTQTELIEPPEPTFSSAATSPGAQRLRGLLSVRTSADREASGCGDPASAGAEHRGADLSAELLCLEARRSSARAWDQAFSCTWPPRADRPRRRVGKPRPTRKAHKDMDVRTRDPATNRAALEICRAAAEAGGRAHYVGGCVRDALFGHGAEDLDIEVFGLEPHRLAELVGRIVPVHLVGASFGVLKARGLPIDVSVPRRERKVGPGHRGFAIDADPHLDVRSAAARR